MAARQPISGDTAGASGGPQGRESLTEVPGVGCGATSNRGSGVAELALQATTALCGVQESCLENWIVCWF